MVKLAHTSKSSRQSTSRTLASVRACRPTQVVVWYKSEDGQTGVAISEGTDRVKAIGALTAAAYEVWNT